MMLSKRLGVAFMLFPLFVAELKICSRKGEIFEMFPFCNVFLDQAKILVVLKFQA